MKCLSVCIFVDVFIIIDNIVLLIGNSIWLWLNGCESCLCLFVVCFFFSGWLCALAMKLLAGPFFYFQILFSSVTSTESMASCSITITIISWAFILSWIYLLMYSRFTSMFLLFRHFHFNQSANLECLRSKKLLSFSCAHNNVSSNNLQIKEVVAECRVHLFCNTTYSFVLLLLSGCFSCQYSQMVKFSLVNVSQVSRSLLSKWDKNLHYIPGPYSGHA